MIGLQIKELRTQKGYSLSQLAQKAGVSKSYLSYIERDMQKNPSLHFLSKVAGTLDVPVDQFLTGETELDKDWNTLVRRAIQEGMSKEDFLQYCEYIKFAKWKEQQENKYL